MTEGPAPLARDQSLDVTDARVEAAAAAAADTAAGRHTWRLGQQRHTVRLEHHLAAPFVWPWLDSDSAGRGGGRCADYLESGSGRTFGGTADSR